MHAVAPLVVAVASFVEVVMRFVVRQHADAPHFVPFVIVVVVAVGVVAFVLHVLAFVVVESRLVLAVMRKCMLVKGLVVWFYMMDQELVLFEVNRVGCPFLKICILRLCQKRERTRESGQQDIYEIVCVWLCERLCPNSIYE